MSHGTCIENVFMYTRPIFQDSQVPVCVYWDEKALGKSL